jgi:hypothetical protein
METPPLEDICRERGLRSGEVALQFNLPGLNASAAASASWSWWYGLLRPKNQKILRIGNHGLFWGLGIVKLGGCEVLSGIPFGASKRVPFRSQVQRNWHSACPNLCWSRWNQEAPEPLLKYAPHHAPPWALCLHAFSLHARSEPIWWCSQTSLANALIPAQTCLPAFCGTGYSIPRGKPSRPQPQMLWGCFALILCGGSNRSGTTQLRTIRRTIRPRSTTYKRGLYHIIENSHQDGPQAAR